MSDTQSSLPVQLSAHSTISEDDCAQWDYAHSRIKSAPPTRGRDYVKHVAALVVLLEPISEINPIFKATVGAFKLVISLAQDRRENDARVDAVLLAQGDMMRTFLYADKLTRNYHNRDELLSSATMEIICEETEDQLNQCHNCMDTYRKQHSIVKYLKAREWKEKLLRFVSTFDELRNRLILAVTFQTASDVGRMVTSMDTILSLLFAARDADEKKELKRINDAGRDKLKTDSDALAKLLAPTGDSSMERIPISRHKVDGDEKKSTFKPDTRKVNTDMQVQELQKDLSASVDELCEKNWKYFERSLALYTDQLQKSIDYSADRVILTLSGPYDRLQHEDLRELWKEMKWIFCVETRIFALALFEYYQDLYTHPHVDASKTTEDPDTDATQNTNNPPSGSKLHPDAWTLPYLQIFTTATATIDDDNSGFIRISEANRFTARIPEGWTLPQYCAYLVEGRHHENAIYRNRIIHLRSKMSEMNAQLLPGNRFAAVLVMNMVYEDVIDKLTMYRQSWTATSSIATELHKLVKQRILEQDEKVRKAMKWVRYHLDETVVDTFIARELKSSLLCCLSTVDRRQWWTSIEKPFDIILSMIDGHIEGMRYKERTIDFAIYHRGIWSGFGPSQSDSTSEDRDYMDCVAETIYHHRSDMSFITDFPLPNFNGDLVAQEYPTWEKFSEKNDVSTIPEGEFVLQWGSGAGGDEFKPIRKDEGLFNLPIDRFCNMCRNEVHNAMYTCLKCDDVDLCQECYDKDPAEHEIEGHRFGHDTVLTATYLQESRRLWIYYQNEREAERCYAKIQEIQAPKPPTKPDDDTWGSVCSDDDDDPHGIKEDDVRKKEDAIPVDIRQETVLYSCFVCQAYITLESGFFICGEYSCRMGRPVCRKCALQQHDNVDTHFWWHSLLPFNLRVLCLESDESFGSESPTAGSPQRTLTDGPKQEVPPQLDLALAGGAQADKLLAGLQASIDRRIRELESKMDERLSGIEVLLKKVLGVDCSIPPISTPTILPVHEDQQGSGGGQYRQHQRAFENTEREVEVDGHAGELEVDDGPSHGVGRGDALEQNEVDDFGIRDGDPEGNFGYASERQNGGYHYGNQVEWQQGYAQYSFTDDED